MGGAPCSKFAVQVAGSFHSWQLPMDTPSGRPKRERRRFKSFYLSSMIRKLGVKKRIRNLLSLFLSMSKPMFGHSIARGATIGRMLRILSCRGPTYDKQVLLLDIARISFPILGRVARSLRKYIAKSPVTTTNIQLQYHHDILEWERKGVPLNSLTHLCARDSSCNRIAHSRARR